MGEEDKSTKIQSYGQNQVARNLCEEHFPEPIIMFLEKPLCKKCIPEYISRQKEQNATGTVSQVAA